jgi:hypothetical protein
VVIAMDRTVATIGSLLVLFSWGCSAGDRKPLSVEQQCAQLEAMAEAYEFRNIADFAGSDAGWYRYADGTPGGIPDVWNETEIVAYCEDLVRAGEIAAVEECPDPPPEHGSNVPVTELDEPGRCGDTRVMMLEAYGNNFWGAGFADWAHNSATSRADGTGYEGISFWARSAPYAEKQFMLNVDDSRTGKIPPDAPETGGLPLATSADQDLDGDTFVGPGDIARGTECRLPPPDELGEPICYKGGVDGIPVGATRVPSPDECGNSFHTRITTTDQWQLFLIPWDELVQWPCPNRLGDGIRHHDIAKFEIKMQQGTHYELYIDNIAFYRQR